MDGPIRRYGQQPIPHRERILPAGISLRCYSGTEDQDRWMDLHHRAFGLATAWSRRQFVREFCQKSWWNSARMWFACDSGGIAVGTICLGEKPGAGGAPVGTVLWLAVDPGRRRRGIGRALVEHLQCEALRLGYHRLELETLAPWEAANRLYESQGFART